MDDRDPEAIFDQYNVSRESRAKIHVYVALLRNWQQRINLIGPATIPHIWHRHILDALQLLPLLPSRCRQIADLGSGAGIPGLVVSLAAGVRTHLYESNHKKCAFLREAVRQTGAPASVHCQRLEDISSFGNSSAVDCVVSRALAPLPRLLAYAEPFLAQGASGLFHKGRDVDLELTEATKYWRFEVTKHPSITDSNGVVLELKEVRRV